MINTLSYYDHQFFLWIHQHLQGTALDIWLVLCRDKLFWIPFYIFILSWIYIYHKSSFWLTLIFLVLTLTLSDQLSSNWLKKSIRRVRPCREMYFDKQFEPLVICGTGFSMPSSHAVNHSAVGNFLFLILGASSRHWRYLLLIWPILIGFAQVFVGVHFPLDVMVGLILGNTIGICVYQVYKIVHRKVITQQ